MHKECCDAEQFLQEEKEIFIHPSEDFEGMRRAGKLAAETLDYITPFVRPGITTEELDRLCHAYILDNKAVPAPLGYKGYPKSICTSVNHVVCHGIPGPKKLMEGDILNIDVTVILEGWYGDTSRMFYVGKVGIKANRLVETTYKALMEGIANVKPGATLGDVGHAIQTVAEKEKFSMVRDFCGHGIGRFFHGAPTVLHYGKQGHGITLKEGMFFTIEPMVNAGGYSVKVLEDEWTAVTKDKSLSAQFEHTIGVTKEGAEIFTLSPKGYKCPPYE